MTDIDMNDQPAVEAAQEVEYTLYKFTNNGDSPYLDGLLTMFYEGVLANQVGIMEAHNLQTGEEEVILVGVELSPEGKPHCYPIAKCLKAEDVRNYLSPDGKGGFFDPLNPAEVEEAHEAMEPLN